MKKLTCTSCGGNLTIDKDEKYAYCEYCHTKYKLNEDLTINFQLDDDIKETLKEGKKIAKPIIIFTIITSGIIFCVAIIIFITIFSEMFKMNTHTISNKNTSNNNIKEEEKITDELNKSMFNAPFSLYSGSQSVFFVNNLLDNIIDNNNKNQKKITVKYIDKKTQDTDEIINIKSQLDKDEYTIIFSYDQKGYINQAEINEMHPSG